MTGQESRPGGRSQAASEVLAVDTFMVAADAHMPRCAPRARARPRSATPTRHCGRRWAPPSRNTLFRWLGKHGWLYQRSGDWHPYQDKIDAGLVTLKTNRPYWDHRRGVDVLPAPTVRITAKGLHKLYVLLGGTDALVEVAS